MSNLTEVNSYAEEFSSIYYKTMDKKRHQIAKMYSDSANLVWNGNGIQGKDNIIKFLENIPASEHSLISLDAQPITFEATQGQTTVLVSARGNVTYEGNSPKKFAQNFIMTVQQSVWKVTSDQFRFQEPT